MTWIPYAEGALRRFDQQDNRRISREDGARQTLTARAILQQLEKQPGVVLADEVGMGKTFVALAVAVSTILARRDATVVVMVPPSLQHKWPRDWKTFQDLYLEGDTTRAIRHATATSGLDFLKLLDDSDENRKQLIFLTHGALSRSLRDGFTRLAVIKRAFKGRSSLTAQRKAFPDHAAKIVPLKTVESRTEGLLGKLLQHPTDTWRSILHKAHDKFQEEIDDDPVPQGLQEALDAMATSDFDPLVEALSELPRRKSSKADEKLRKVRSKLNDLMETVWGKALQQVRIQLPLLILDEAHHVKNPKTRLASLFVNEELAAASDGDGGPKKVTGAGALAGKCERMLFLTATPFQLGHQELVNVLRRFDGINWKSRRRPTMSRQEFGDQLDALANTLDRAQTEALRLDRAWNRLDEESVGRTEDEVLAWLDRGRVDAGETLARDIAARIDATRAAMSQAEECLRPLVLRHIKPAHLPTHPDVARRSLLPGAAILEDPSKAEAGLSIDPKVLLPFLLAGRAQGILAAAKNRRALFAEGLASSFEAYLDTRAPNKVDAVDDVAETVVANDDEEVRWYLERLDAALPRKNSGAWESHPKIKATVDQVVRLWRDGEKVLVFCHYRATGRALRRHISASLLREIRRLGRQRLRLPEDASDAVIDAELERIGKRFFDQDGPIRSRVTQALTQIIRDAENGSSADTGETSVVDVCLRFIRTPGFLVRYVDLGHSDLADAFGDALAKDLGGISLRRRIQSFVKFLAESTPEERKEYLQALSEIQTGTHIGREPIIDDADERGAAHGTVDLLPDVRLANGRVSGETRRRLLLTFNTPLFPEILVASSVLSEGVDLHRYCRHIIHHDLCWNPSTLEQRTGRVDRIGSKAESVGQSIHVYLPYVAATQDEKMYRVVRDRERWFQIVLGEKFEIDEAATERQASRVPLPKSIADSLTMKLHTDAGR